MTLRASLSALLVCMLCGCHHPQSEMLGREIDVQIDIGRYGNDVAFWWGTPPNDILAVIARDVRSPEERVSGRPATHPMDLPASGMVTLRGTIETVPHGEAMYSWGLTRDDGRRLATKGVYLRLSRVGSAR